MKINLASIDRNNFMVHEHMIGGEVVYLVQAIHLGCFWTPETMIYRSSVWNANGEPVSLSYKKFFNWDENPKIDPMPESLKGAQMIEKIDGSALIFSRYKGHTVIRTRGTTDARQLDNGHEIDVLLTKYPGFLQFLESFQDSTPFSYIFEWVSPTNKIVLDYGPEPDMFLTGMIQHSNYVMYPQATLDKFAADLGLRRPKTFHYDSIEEMKASVEAFQGVEGLCVYYNGGQNIRKVKTAEYLCKHRMKSELASIDRVVDVWTIAGRPTYQEFFDYCSKTFDHEIATDARGFISTICDGWKEVLLIEKSMREKAAELSGLSRKDQAQIVLQKWGNTNRASFVFQILDGKKWSDETYKKLLYQVIKVK